jgi:hypothetical protein
VTRLGGPNANVCYPLQEDPELAEGIEPARLRTRQFAVNMAMVHQARVDTRLHMLFWHLGAAGGT